MWEVKIAPGTDKFINTSVEFSFIVFQKKKRKSRKKKRKPE